MVVFINLAFPLLKERLIGTKGERENLREGGRRASCIWRESNQIEQ